MRMMVLLYSDSMDGETVSISRMLWMMREFSSCMSLHVQPTHLHSKSSTPVALDLQTAMMAISSVMNPHQPRSQANTFISMRKHHHVLNPSIPREAHPHHHYWISLNISQTGLA